jgi:hypothetical protein
VQGWRTGPGPAGASPSPHGPPLKAKPCCAKENGRETQEGRRGHRPAPGLRAAKPWPLMCSGAVIVAQVRRSAQALQFTTGATPGASAGRWMHPSAWWNPLFVTRRQRGSCLGKTVGNLRFAVSGEAGHASMWRLWATRNHGDVYLASYGTARDMKLSFHRSGICRYAMTTESGLKAPGSDDRVLSRWRRPEIPPRGIGNFTPLARLAFPTDYLSRPATRPERLSKAMALPPAPSGQACFVELGLTREDEAKVVGTHLGVPNGLAVYSKVYEDVAVFVRWYHTDWENVDLDVPPTPAAPDSAYRFTRYGDPTRPLRITLKSKPSDGEPILIHELGGDRVALSTTPLMMSLPTPAV